MAGGQLPFGLAPSGSLTNYTPTLHERITDAVRQYNPFFTDDRAGQQQAERVTQALEIPFGFATGMYDAGGEAGRGNFGTAAVLGAMAGIPGKIPDVVEQRGVKILELLRSGKAKKITDDMLDMGDSVLNARLNDYLFKNYDLPMDDTSRMARAKDGGFEGPTFHASAEDFAAVDPRRADTGSSLGTGERAFWTTTQPKTADTYLPGAWVREGNGGAPIGNGVERYYTEGSNVMPAMNRTSNANVWDMGGGLYRSGDVSRAIKEARKDKSGAVVFNRMKDQGVMGLGSGSAANTSVAAIDPTSVRSRFARFDPRLKHLRNLNAGLAGASLLGYGLLDDETVK
jgi:hypothetical protein